MPTTPIDQLLPDIPDGYIAGLPGDMADIGLKDTISRVNNGTKPIPFGAAVVEGPADPTCINTDPGCQAYTAGFAVLGFAKSDYALYPATAQFADANGYLQYQPGDMVPVVRDGRMRAVADGDISAGVGVAVGTDGLPTATGGTVVAGVFWETATKADHVGIIQISLDR
jgi:hypothetical protein